MKKKYLKKLEKMKGPITVTCICGKCEPPRVINKSKIEEIIEQVDKHTEQELKLEN